jgi:hypothetical protein
MSWGVDGGRAASHVNGVEVFLAPSFPSTPPSKTKEAITKFSFHSANTGPSLSRMIEMGKGVFLKASISPLPIQ